ncbi:Major core protein [Wuhan heteroptera virus 3]|uniref:Major core protein n=1 Tax=Wuhan heteroptera virus 3 TaxID=1923703 RepID=UPI00090B591B|nr:Major core protein [Wuhan heteroptera virus 3]APG79067.1 Major core protein [Wuhan heteroptera virus 3]APG79203.1 Major core protein [Wuhan heteroptera virus 3]
MNKTKFKKLSDLKDKPDKSKTKTEAAQPPEQKVKFEKTKQIEDATRTANLKQIRKDKMKTLAQKASIKVKEEKLISSVKAVLDKNIDKPEPTKPSNASIKLTETKTKSKKDEAIVPKVKINSSDDKDTNDLESQSDKSNANKNKEEPLEMKDNKPVALTSNQQLVKVNLLKEKLILTNKINLTFTVDDVIGYRVPTEFTTQLEMAKLVWLYPLETYPSFFSQIATEVENKAISLGTYGEQINLKLDKEVKIFETSSKVYNQNTSHVYVMFEPTGFGNNDISKMKEFNNDQDIYRKVVFAVNNSQSRYKQSLFATNIVRMLAFLRHSGFYFKNLDYVVLNTDLNSTVLGQVLTGKELMSDGVPNVLYSGYKYIDRAIQTELINTFLVANNTLKFPLGRYHKIKAFENILKFYCIASTDQWVAALSFLNMKILENHRIQDNIFIDELAAFVNEESKISLSASHPWIQEISYAITYKIPDYTNYLFGQFFFPANRAFQADLAIQFFNAAEILDSALPYDYIQGNFIQAADNDVLRQVLSILKHSKFENIVYIIVLEAFGVSDNFSLTGINNTRGLRGLFMVLELFLAVIFTPNIFKKLMFKYIPLLYNFLGQYFPEEMEAYKARYGEYGRMEHNTWKKKDITYDQLALSEGILPSILVKEPTGQNGQNFQFLKKVYKLLKIQYYPIELKKRKAAKFPYVNDSYTYYSSWPVGLMNQNNGEDEKLASRVRILFKKFNQIAKEVMQQTTFFNAPQNNTNTNNSNTLKGILASIQTLILSSVPAFTRYAAAFTIRLMNMPLFSGRVEDILFNVSAAFKDDYRIFFVGPIGKNLAGIRTDHGLAPASTRVNINLFQLLNVFLNIVSPEGRAEPFKSESVTYKLATDLPTFDPVDLWQQYQKEVGNNKVKLEVLQLFNDIIDPTSDESIFGRFRNNIDVAQNPTVIKDILHFYSKEAGAALDDVFRIYTNEYMGTLFQDPSRIKFQLAILNSDLSVFSYLMPTTIIGKSYTLVDDNFYRRLDIGAGLLDQSSYFKGNKIKGVALYRAFPQNIIMTDIAEDRGITMEYTLGFTFKNVPVSHTDTVNNVFTFVQKYFYKIDDQVYEVERPELIPPNHYHTLLIKNPQDVHDSMAMDFLKKAVLQSKMRVDFTELVLDYNIVMLSSFTMTNNIEHALLDNIFTFTNPTGFPVVNLYDSRNLIFLQDTTTYSTFERIVWPLQKVDDIYVAIGLNILDRERSPLIRRNFFARPINPATVDDDLENLVRYPPTIVNPVVSLTNLATDELPVVDIGISNLLT